MPCIWAIGLPAPLAGKATCVAGAIGSCEASDSERPAIVLLLPISQKDVHHRMQLWPADNGETKCICKGS